MGVPLASVVLKGSLYSPFRMNLRSSSLTLRRVRGVDKDEFEDDF